MMAAGHAYADFALQSPHHSAAKLPGNNTGIPWYAGLGCHSLIHGGIVALITGWWVLGVAETISHAIIDYSNGRGWITPRTDQILHALCKVIWAWLTVSVGPGLVH